MTLLEFIEANRAKIDKRILGVVPSMSSLTDSDRKKFVRNDPGLRRMALRAGWDPKPAGREEG